MKIGVGMIEELVTCDFCKKTSITEDYWILSEHIRPKNVFQGTGTLTPSIRVGRYNHCCQECIKKLGNHYEIPRVGD